MKKYTFASLAAVMALGIVSSAFASSATKPTATATTKPAASPATPAPTLAAPATAGGLTDKAGKSYVGNAAAGEKIVKSTCQTCHSIKEGENKIGPSLFGVVGRTSGTVAGYNYSKANKDAHKVWAEQTLFDYLEAPRAMIPGTKMSFIGLKKPQDRADVVAFLKTKTK